MIAWLTMVVQVAFAGLNSRRNLLFENLALRHQLLVLSRTNKRPRLTSLDRALWAWLSQSWADWKIPLRFVQPSTVIQWHRSRCRLFWRWKSRPRKPGRQTICPNTIDLIQQMSHANPLWGAPRIHGELLKLGLAVAQRSVAKYMIPRSRRPTSPNWKTFLRNHIDSMVSVDLLTVPTLTFQVLYVFIVLSHHRRRMLHFNIIDSPSARWTAQQLREAFGFASPPKYLLRDRDSIYGREFQARAFALGLDELRIAPRSSLAVALRRTFDRFGPARMFGSRRCVQRGSPPPFAHGLFLVLSPEPNPLVLEQGRPGITPGMPTGRRKDCSLPGSGRTSSSLRAPGRLTRTPRLGSRHRSFNPYRIAPDGSQ